MDRPVTSRVRVALNALILLAGCLAGAAVAVATGQQALAGTVPSAPPGWTTVFGDDFAGAAGSAPSSANWFYDIGTDSGNEEINRQHQLDQQRLPGRQGPPGAEGDQQRR